MPTTIEWKPVDDEHKPPAGVPLLVYHERHAYCIAAYMAGPDIWKNLDGMYVMATPPTHWCGLTLPPGVWGNEDEQ